MEEEIKRNNDGTESKGLLDILKKRKAKISKAERVRSLLEKQKGWFKKKESLTDFEEPVLFFCRRDGKMEIYEKATAGDFTFTHSTGKERIITLRPADQQTFEYAGRRVRCYIGHEDRPFTGWDNPVVDSETVMQGYIKTKATDMKYQEAMAKLGVKNKMTWLWIIAGIIGTIGAVIILGSMFIPPDVLDKIFKTGQYAKQSVPNADVPTAGIILAMIKNKFK